MRRPRVAFVLSLILVAPAWPHEAPTAGFGTLSLDAPKETAQFAFLIGEWSCKTRRMGRDGSLTDGPDATWTGSYVLDGWAIQDEWISTGPGGQPVLGTNVRSFNPTTGKWDNRWLAAGSLEWKYFRGRAGR